MTIVWGLDEEDESYRPSGDPGVSLEQRAPWHDLLRITL